jgi:ribonuclease HI
MTIYAYTDGASRGNPGESGIGIILRDEQGMILFSGGGYIGTTTNNAAEYQALLACLKKASTLQCKRLVVHSDSELMVRQLQGKYRVKDKQLQRFFIQAHELLKNASFDFEIIHVEREKNQDADLLANAGIESKQNLSL